MWLLGQLLATQDAYLYVQQTPRSQETGKPVHSNVEYFPSFPQIL